MLRALLRSYTVPRNKLHAVKWYSVSTDPEMSLFPSLNSITAQDLTTAEPVKGKYFIARSKTGNLPVYSEIKHSGSRIETHIRGVEGDPLQLKLDLQRKLDFIPSKDWRVNMTANKIIIKGNYVTLVKKILSNVF